MAKNLFNRYVWLAEAVYNSKHGLTLEEINDRWEQTDLSGGDPIPQRTFHRYRRQIESLFDINIECRKSTNTYYIDNADDIREGGLRRWLINTFAVNNLVNESHRLKNRIQFENIPSGQQFLTQIIDAMKCGVRIEMTYASYWSDPGTFLLEPYFVKVFKQRWYVVGKSDNVRIYALDRIQNLETTAESFQLPDNFDPEEFFYNSYGVIADEDITAETVIIKVESDQARYIRALPLHHSQRETETTADYSFFEYYIKPTYDFRQELLSHGADVEVLSPAWFRSEMKTVVSEMKQCYMRK